MKDYTGEAQKILFNSKNNVQTVAELLKKIDTLETAATEAREMIVNKFTLQIRYQIPDWYEIFNKLNKAIRK